MSPELSHNRYSLDVAFPQVYTTVEKLNKLPLFHEIEEIKMEIRHIIIPLSVIMLISKTAEGLKCYQCDSTLDHNCQEYFNHDNPNIPLKATDCQMYNAKFCIKATGLWGGIVGTHRFCSSRDLGNQCQDMRFPDHSRKYRGCIYTCTAEGCNSAHGVPYSYPVIILGVLSAVVAMVMRR